MTQTPALYALNAGEISRFALARVDLAKLRIACERQRNFIPTALGPTMFRPGTEFIQGMPSDAPGWLGTFFNKSSEKALIVLSEAVGMFFLIDDDYLERPSVSAAITNGTFNADLSGWTDSDESGAASTWATGGYASLLGTGTNFAQIDQQITVSNPGVEHGLRVIIQRNEVRLKVGTIQGEGDYLDALLGEGVYSLAFTPPGNFWIRLANEKDYPSLVDSISVEAAGTVALPSPWSTTAEFDTLNYVQSGDVIFITGGGKQQRRIERWTANSRSWGIARYRADDGPFRLGNNTSTTITPGSTSGTTALTASRGVFKSGHVGALFRLTHATQTKTATLAALNDATGEIRVSGLTTHAATSTSPGNASTRVFAISITGTFDATIQLQRSLAEPGDWADVDGESYTAPVDKTYDDKLDNQIIYYRLICTAYTSGSATATLTYTGAAQTGIVRITNVASSTSATADVLQQIGEATATSDWAEGEWSDYRGWPNAVAIHDGRMTWGHGIKTQLSVSDAYHSFDDTVEGDSGPINRTITTGSADGIHWLLSLQRLIAATSTQLVSIRSNAFDEPLSPTAFTARTCSDDGAASGVRALSVQGHGIYAGAANRLFKLVMQSGADYHSLPIDRLKPEMYASGIADISAQRKPDNALLFPVLNNGQIGLCAFNQEEEIEALCSWDTEGAFERTTVVPGSDEDEVYFIVQRTVNSVTKRFIEKLAKRSDCQGGVLSRNVDCHMIYTGAPTTTVSALHLAGKTVAVWGDGAPLATALVLNGSGTGTIPVSVSNYVVGLRYTGQIKTAKLAYAAEGGGTALTLKKRVSRVGLVMADTVWDGIRVGRDFDHLTKLPHTYRGKPLNAGQVLVEYDDIPGSFNGGWTPDARVCIEVASPYCATIQALAIHMETNELSEPNAPPRDR